MIVYSVYSLDSRSPSSSCLFLTQEEAQKFVDSLGGGAASNYVIHPTQVISSCDFKPEKCPFCGEVMK
jgi:hypothetical protein